MKFIALVFFTTAFVSQAGAQKRPEILINETESHLELSLSSIQDSVLVGQLRGLNDFQKPVILTWDNPGGYISSSWNLSLAVIALADRVYNDTQKPLIFKIEKSCDSSCILAFLIVASNARKSAYKKIEIQVNAEARFGFHAAYLYDEKNIDLEGVEYYKKTMLRYGASEAWMKTHSQIFLNPFITSLTAAQLVKDQSLIVLESEL